VAEYVEAVVVRCARPASARPGDRAVIHPDGTIEGFVGGSCADETVRLHALRALETGEPILLKIVPGEAADEEGSVVVANPCLSGGALEVFLQPRVRALLQPPARGWQAEKIQVQCQSCHAISVFDPGRIGQRCDLLTCSGSIAGIGVVVDSWAGNPPPPTKSSSTPAEKDRRNDGELFMGRRG